MNISNEQKELIIRKFFLLCDNFLPVKEVKKNIEIFFREQSIEGETFFQAPERSFKIYFWNQEYKSLEFLCQVVSHEFTHVLFYLVRGKHDHDQLFKVYALGFYFWLLKQN